MLTEPPRIRWRRRAQLVTSRPRIVIVPSQRRVSEASPQRRVSVCRALIVRC
ncbi:hypothetical protein G6O69_24765 [Pseudenhygromyxa sp. WMMC2535]|uniref:hypothetical protein n=1 Tax=Pseudenhygromyxa sp. WMMC2535 TaxID=2712867 RepID=UPI001595DF61|nr:hypothetical protein [Pseudenhygromyxa sp. WMMC2535]NVB41075.1 hypothetical protein [Pseudenhygromyxa sp. WMMC2535]